MGIGVRLIRDGWMGGSSLGVLRCWILRVITFVEMFLMMITMMVVSWYCV